MYLYVRVAGKVTRTILVFSFRGKMRPVGGSVEAWLRSYDSLWLYVLLLAHKKVFVKT